MANPPPFWPVVLEDPFEVVSYLGHGRSSVEKVVRKGNEVATYARKRFARPGSDDELKQIRNEVDIIKKLQQAHIVEFVDCYSCHGLIYLLLLPVADETLRDFFQRTEPENLPYEAKLDASRTMVRWAACLFYALDYLHHQGIRHKDIKPENILAKGDRVYLTDFGLSRDSADLSTSGTNGPAQGTQTYYAPELAQERPRGTPADVWALGCVLLEICTVASGTTRQVFADHRRGNQTRTSATAYFECTPSVLFDWIWLLLLGEYIEDTQIRVLVRKLVLLAFLMLDPDPGQRITACQLVNLSRTKEYPDFRDIGDLACAECRTGGCSEDAPTHSIFDTIIIAYVENNGKLKKPKTTSETPQVWEEIKQEWLEKHMWWDYEGSDIGEEPSISEESDINEDWDSSEWVDLGSELDELDD